METIYHIATESDWCQGEGSGEYTPEAFAREGFIHCSTRDQVIPVANRLFLGRRDLWLLAISVELVGAEVRYENLEGGVEDFPHIYGVLPRQAVMERVRLGIREDGAFCFPEFSCE